MDLKEYHRLDKELDNLQLSYDYVDISYLVRNHIIATLRAKNNSGNIEVKLDKSKLKRLLISCFKTLRFSFKKKSIWTFSNSERRKMFEGIYYDRVASIVSESYDDVLFIESPILVNHKNPSKDTILSDALFYLGAYVFSKIFYKKNKLNVDIRLYDIVDNYNIKLNIESIVKRFIGQYKFMIFFTKYCSKPKIVFFVCPNSYYGYSYAFKELNIPIVELQHGIIYPLHPSYNSILDENKLFNFKPDFLFTYGTKDKELSEKLGYVKSGSTFVVGSYGLWKAKNDKNISAYLAGLMNKDFKTIVIAATVVDIDALYQFCLDLEKKSDNYNIFLLPRHKTNQFQDTKNVKVLNVDKTNIFETYNIADYLLTICSTAALESLFMGIPTFVLEEDGISLFRENYPYLESLNYVQSSNQLLQVIEERSYSKHCQIDVDQIYSKDVILNFNKAMQKINRI